TDPVAPSENDPPATTVHTLNTREPRRDLVRTLHGAFFIGRRARRIHAGPGEVTAKGGVVTEGACGVPPPRRRSARSAGRGTRSRAGVPRSRPNPGRGAVS